MDFSKFNFMVALFAMLFTSTLITSTLAQSYTSWDSLPSCGSWCLQGAVDAIDSACVGLNTQQSYLECQCNSTSFIIGYHDCLVAECGNGNETNPTVVAVEEAAPALCSKFHCSAAKPLLTESAIAPSSVLPTSSWTSFSTSSSTSAPGTVTIHGTVSLRYYATLTTLPNGAVLTIVTGTSTITTVMSSDSSGITTSTSLTITSSSPSGATPVSTPAVSAPTTSIVSSVTSFTPHSVSASSSTSILTTINTSSAYVTGAAGGQDTPNQEPKRTLSVGATVGIGLGTGTGVMLLVIAGILGFRHHREKSKFFGAVDPRDPPYPDTAAEYNANNEILRKTAAPQMFQPPMYWPPGPAELGGNEVPHAR